MAKTVYCFRSLTILSPLIDVGTRKEILLEYLSIVVVVILFLEETLDLF